MLFPAPLGPANTYNWGVIWKFFAPCGSGQSQHSLEPLLRDPDIPWLTMTYRPWFGKDYKDRWLVFASEDQQQ